MRDFKTNFSGIRDYMNSNERLSKSLSLGDMKEERIGGEVYHHHPIMHEGKKVGRIMVRASYTRGVDPEIPVDYAGLNKQHQGKHSLGGVMKQLVSRYPQARHVTGYRTTGQKTGSFKFKIPGRD